MFINGEWVDAQSGETFEVTNPATGEKIGEMPDGSAVDAERAVAAADAAFGAWSTTTAFARAEILMRAWQLMNERADDLAHLMTTEQGKPLKAARFEVGMALTFSAGSPKKPGASQVSGCHRPALISVFSACVNQLGWWPPSRHGTTRCRCSPARWVQRWQRGAPWF